MKINLTFVSMFFFIVFFGSVLIPSNAEKSEKDKNLGSSAKIIFLHHSTGECIWNGGVQTWFKDYNKKNNTKYSITDKDYPANKPYGWNNYPYDYWNIWVKNAGDKAYKNEQTLEMLTKSFDVIIFKHCFPVSEVQKGSSEPDVTSEEKTVENYKLQYAALKKKMLEFPDSRFIVWTGAALDKKSTNEEQAESAKTFFDWVKSDWDEKGDNIFVWDFWQLETEGSLYIKDEYSMKKGDSHPNKNFSKKVAPFFCQRIVDVITGKGDEKSLTGDNSFFSGDLGKNIKIIFLHHSTGGCIWNGGVEKCFKDYNTKNTTSYDVIQVNYPKSSPYGWKNYPYDYWYIWVQNAGTEKFKDEDTLEILTEKFNVIIFKHCFPVSSIKADTGKPDVTSEDKRTENYKLQYDALKKKMQQFPKNRFIVWTGAALNKSATNEESAKCAKAFFDWVKSDWDEKGDNIFVWDFWELETEGGLYLKNEFAANKGDSHPGTEFSKTVAPYFAQRIINVIKGKGDSTSLTGK